MNDEPDDPEQLERQARELRIRLDTVLAELDHRRHELTDWRLQLRRHWKKLALVGGGVLALVGGLAALRSHRRALRNRPLEKLRRLREAVARMVDDPDAVAPRRKRTTRQMLLAAGKPAVAGMVGRWTRRGS